jgi:DNA-binding transcriptional ArsR family regulator
VIVGLIGDRWATAAELAEEIGVPPEEVQAALASLQEMGIVEELSPRSGDGPTEWTNVRKFRRIDGEEWASMPPREREELAATAARLMISDLDLAVRRERLGLRLNEHYTRIALDLDEQGWDEMAAIHLGAFNATEAVRERSRRRLRASGETPSHAHSLQFFMEFPPEGERERRWATRRETGRPPAGATWRHNAGQTSAGHGAL